MSAAVTSVFAAAWLGFEVGVLFLAGRRLGAWMASPEDSVVEVALAGLASALSLLIGSALLLALLGILNTFTLLAMIVGTSAIVLWRCPSAPIPAVSVPGLMTSAAVGISVVVGAVAIGLAFSGPPSHQAETIRYHVINAAQWLNTGSIWQLGYGPPGVFSAVFPGNGELLGTWLMLPVHDDRLAYIAPVPFIALTLLAASSIARSLRAPGWLGALAALALVCTPLSFLTTFKALTTDMAVVGSMTAAMAFGMLARGRPQRARFVLLAGLCLGLAAGSKYTALPSVFAVVVYLAITQAQRVRAVLVVGAAGLLLAGPWYLRNAILTGNPVFPQPISIGGVLLAAGGSSPLLSRSSTLMQHLVPPDPGLLGAWLGQVASLFGPAAILVVGDLAVLAWAAAKRDRATATVAAVAAACCLVYPVLPLTAGVPELQVPLMASNLRYLLPAAVLAAVVASARGPRRVMFGLVAVALGYDAVNIALGSGIRPDIIFGARTAAVIAAVLLTAVGLGAIALTERASQATRAASLQMGAVAGLAATAVVGAGLFLQVGSQPDRVGDALARMGRPQGEVAVVDSQDVRATLGPDLRRQVVAVGDGRVGLETSLSNPQAFNARLASLAPTLVVVGAATAGAESARPPGWVPPADWVAVGRIGGATIYSTGY